jgi:nicotinamidase-related amidase
VSTALLLVDIQNEYFEGGAMVLEGSAEAAIQARHLLTCFRHNHLPAVFIQHVAASADASSFASGSRGVALYSSIRPLPGEPVITKHHPNGFRETRLLDVLQGYKVERLVICGMMTHMCIDATTRAAADLGFRCIIAADACATRDLAFDDVTVSAATVQRTTLAALNGTYAEVKTTEAIVAMMQQSPDCADGHSLDAESRHE